MDLQGENRILVKEGLCRLKNTKNQGLQELIRANSLEDAKITAYHIGFVLGPVSYTHLMGRWKFRSCTTCTEL